MKIQKKENCEICYFSVYIRKKNKYYCINRQQIVLKGRIFIINKKTHICDNYNRLF
jgi:hypothetical protein